MRRAQESQLRRIRSRIRFSALAALIGTLAVTAVACGGGGRDDDGSGPISPLDYANLSGQIRIDGSSTVFPISEAVAEEFSRVSDVRVNVAFSGTGGGFEKFCRGEIQVSDASRPMKDGEREACRDKGIDDVVEFQVAIDALTVVINPANQWAACLRPDQLQELFRDGGAKKWSDVDSSWPDEDIDFYYPGADSGTFDYFNEAIIGKEANHRGDGTASEDDNILLKAVEEDRNAIAYFGFAYFKEAGDQLRAVSIDDGAGCVSPSAETVLAGTYTPLSRPLFMYTRESLLRDRPEVAGFTSFYLDSASTLVPEVGYIEMDETTFAAQVSKLEPFLAQAGAD